MDSGEDVDLFVLLVQKVLQLLDFSLERSHAFLQRLGVAAGKCATTQLVARLALKTDVGALRTTRANAITANLLAATAIAGLCDATLGTVADLDDFHGENAGHCGWMLPCSCRTRYRTTDFLSG